MKVLSLFSGVGGFDLGLERAGMQTVFQCEWDKHATKILERHWPDVPRWDDISTLTGKHILQHAPVIDIVAWGSPCQDLSVAGKRAGLDGSRSGLFHEGIRIIKELQEETNGKYPRISLWENVYGALSSNKGADFGVILDEMAEAGALVQEWRVLDAQYFGVPQRRRRVFLVSIFDSATAARCPNPLLPVSQSVRRNTETSGTERQEPAGTTTQSLGSGSDIANTISASLYHHGTVVNQDANNGHVVVDTNHARPVGSAVLGSEIVGALNAVDYKWPQNQQLEENKFIPVETFTEEALAFDGYNQTVGNVSQTIRADKSDGDHVGMVLQAFTKAKRAQSTTDNETWVEGKPAPTLNAFDQGDTRATTVIAFATNQRAELRDLEDKAVALSAEPGTNQQTYIAFENSYRDAARIAENGITQTLSAKMGTGGGNTPMVAIGIQGTVIGRQDHNGPAGKGHTDEGDPMFTLTSTDIHAVAFTLREREGKPGGGKGPLVTEEKSGTLAAGGNDQTVFQYDGYNQRIYQDDVSVTIRIGRDSSDFVAQPIDAAGFKPGASANAHSIGYEEGLSPSLEAGGGGNNRPAVLEPTMAVRRLTPIECERLMGWPDNWTEGQADTHRYKQCGNGVASPVATWIAQHLQQLDKDTNATPTQTPTT